LLSTRRSATAVVGEPLAGAFWRAEYGFEFVPIGGAATVGSGDGQIDSAAADGSGDVGALGAAVDLAAETSGLLLVCDATDRAASNEPAGAVARVAEESCTAWMVVAVQRRVFGAQWTGLRTHFNGDL